MRGGIDAVPSMDRYISPTALWSVVINDNRGHAKNGTKTGTMLAKKRAKHMQKIYHRFTRRSYQSVGPVRPYQLQRVSAASYHIPLPLP